jgi:hypothetical protein
MTKCLGLLLLVLGPIAGLPTAGWSQTFPADFPVVARTELTQEFATRTRWSLVVTQEPATAEAPGDLHFCFLHDGRAACPSVAIHFRCDYLDRQPACPPATAANDDRLHYNHLGAVAILHPKGQTTPLLVVSAVGNWVGPHTQAGKIVWAYRRDRDSFEEIFSGSRNVAAEEEVRLVAGGPLSGDILSADLTERSPFPFVITVYRLQRAARYVKTLEYRGRTRYRDGNALLVLDGEMPEIERRLHLRRPGDPLPLPLRLPMRCRAIEQHDGLEWCR